MGEKMKKLFVVLTLAVLGSQAIASPWVQKLKPTYRGDRLDWCLDYGSNCGQPVVNEYCKSMGLRGTQYFKQASNIGRTRLMTDAVCEDSYCDGFDYLYCRKLNETYSKPTYRGDRLDWCAEYGTQCGKPAADAFCKKQGWNKAYDYAEDQNIGRTRLLNDAVCEANYCDGFKYIKCMD